MKISTGRWLRLIVAGAWAVGAACSGSSPTQPIPLPSATPAPVPTPSASPSPSPGTASCPLGKGTFDAPCSRRGPMLLPEVDAAIDQLVQESPDLFNLNDLVGPGGFRVRNVDGYMAGLIRILQAKGLCAGLLAEDLQVKNNNEFSEEYDVILSSGYIRRGQGSYSTTCRPAAFPVDPRDVIARVPIFMFGAQCPDGKTSAPPGIKEMPVDCALHVTATPKDQNNRDVDPRFHGPNIEWTVRDGQDRIRLEDFPGQPFNKKVVGVQQGDFSLCAVVQGVEGCFNGKVTP